MSERSIALPERPVTIARASTERGSSLCDRTSVLTSQLDDAGHAELISAYRYPASTALFGYILIRGAAISPLDFTDCPSIFFYGQSMGSQ